MQNSVAAGTAERGLSPSRISVLTLIHCDNSTAVGIANNTVKWQRSCSMEMRFFWVADAVEQDKFDMKYYPGKENLADYQSKHHIGAHHTAVRPWYLHELTSVRELPRAD
jgi:hypothetical protein